MHAIDTRANLEQYGTIRGAFQYRSASSASGHRGLGLIYLLPKFKQQLRDFPNVIGGCRSDRKQLFAVFVQRTLQTLPKKDSRNRGEGRGGFWSNP